MSNVVKYHTKLNDIVKAAANCPVYGWRFNKFPKSFEEFPITTKQHLYEGIENYIFNPNAAKKYRESIYLTPSGGSTYNKSGDLSNIFVNVMDAKENELQRTLFASFVSKYNIINSSHIFGNLFGATKLYKGEDVNRSIIEKCGGTNISLERTCPDDLVYLYLKRFGANGIAANPARLLRFVQYLNDNNLSDLYLENLFYGGESMSLLKLDIIKNTIKCNNVIGLYGSAEAGVWTLQNEQIFGNKYYYYDPNIMYVEIEENTKEILLTSLLKYRYPLIKYNTGDCGKIIDINENYGILEIFGRNELSFSIGGDYYDITDTNDLGIFFNQFIQFQIVIDSGDKGFDKLHVLLVNNDNSLNETECTNQLDNLIHSWYGERKIFISCEFCDIATLQTSKTSGKVIPIVDLRKLL